MDFPDGPIVWPECSKKLVIDFPDEEQIWEAGLKVLGYPPNWSRSLDEVTRIRKWLEVNFVPF